MEKKYYIGIDGGTESVGWAVTDSDYNIIKLRGKWLWGSYLFDEAQTAAERRGYRTARRRLARTHHRLMLLQQLFAEEIYKVDPTFFIRLNDSKLYQEDKDDRIKSKYVLFGDSMYDDRQYFKQYPTIFHLRKAAINGEISDIRMLYLAIHHIVKNRGHFLFDGQKLDAVSDNVVKEKFYEINNILEEMNEDNSTIPLENIDGVIETLRKDITKKPTIISTALGVGKNKQQKAIVNGICGGNVNLKDLYNIEIEDNDIKAFSFDKADFDDVCMPNIVKLVGEDRAELVRVMKAVYDWSLLCNILLGENYLSTAKVNTYEEHKKDLAWLKNHVKTNCPEKYQQVFRRKDGVNNYAAYIGMDKHRSYKKCSKTDFYSFLKKELDIQDQTIIDKMSNGTFLQKQISSANSVIPYQLHLRELEEILKHAEKKFAFLNNVDNGITVSKKIVALMTFRIPYYVGPLTTVGSQFAWVAKKEGMENVKITPWNFNEVVDKEESETRFIDRMTNKCRYLPQCDVLPAKSLLYSEYTFLDELNNLRIRGQKNEKAKQLILEYAKSHKEVKLKRCLELLKKHCELEDDATLDVFSGIDQDFKCSLASYIDFKNIIKDKVDTHSEMCEEIIKWITIISDKKRLADLIKRNYGKILDDVQINKLAKLRYAGWGRLSKEFLTEIKGLTDSNGEVLPIIECMRRYNLNHMQLLSNDYGFLSAIRDYNNTELSDERVTYNTVANQYCSPSVKRAIWRVICLVKEIEKIMGCAPSKVFIEMARGGDDADKGKRTDSRKNKILKLYQSIKGEQREWEKEITELPDTKFNSVKLMLYYLQMGRDMYTGQALSLDDIFNSSVVDKDHIYPQSQIKDDSLDNLVLTMRPNNIDKDDVYPLSKDIQHQMKGFWQELKEKGLMTNEKYYRLTRTTPLTTNEMTDFINRQLVETRQSTKLVAKLLEKMLPNSKIVYSKARNVSEFNAENKIIKVRELNDLHHAKDAYMNIVVGNVYNTKFGYNASEYFKENNAKSYNLKYLFARDIPGAWKVADKQRIIDTVNNKNNCIVVRCSREAKGGFYGANSRTKDTAGLIPLKESGAISNTSKYGGYNIVKPAYFMLVRSKGKKGKTLLSLEVVSTLMSKKYGGNKEQLTRYCQDQYNLKDPEILIDKIKINALLCINGSYAYLRGMSKREIILWNANELYLDYDSTKYLKYISNSFRNKEKYHSDKLLLDKNITAEGNLQIFDTLVAKLASPVYAGLSIARFADVIRKKREDFAELELEIQCETIMEILKLMQCNSTTSNLLTVGGKKHSGKLLINKFIQDNKIKLIYQSPTGYYSKVVDLSQYL